MSEAGSAPLIVGRIGAAYGVRGWVRIHSFTEPMENLLGYKELSLRQKDGWRAVVIEEGRRHGKGLIAHIAGCDDRDQAEALKGSEIGVSAAELPALPEGEFYWHQLEGLAVYSGGELLGKVHHLLETGANDVLVVRPCRGSRDQRERLIPWLLPSVVKEVDLTAGRLNVDWDAEF
jgi:16S rRNA processing protein RimM